MKILITVFEEASLANEDWRLMEEFSSINLLSVQIENLEHRSQGLDFVCTASKLRVFSLCNASHYNQQINKRFFSPLWHKTTKNNCTLQGFLIIYISGQLAAAAVLISLKYQSHQADSSDKVIQLPSVLTE